MSYENRLTGTVKMFESNWGFIQPDDGSKDHFVHHSEIQMDGYKFLEVGDKVEFESETTNRGIQAVNVVKLA